MRASSLSTPSATMDRPRAWARLMAAETRTVAAGGAAGGAGREGVAGGAAPDPGHERPVDLQHVDGIAAEVAQRGVAGPEVVDGQAHPELLQGQAAVGRLLDVVHEHALGDLEAQAVRGHAGLVEHGPDDVDEPRL